MRVSTKRILSIGISAILLIVALIVYATLIKPEVEKINGKRALVASKTALYNNQDRAVSQVNKLITDFKNIQRLEENISLAMPDGEETVQALRQIESMSSQAGVVITGLNFKASLPRASSQPFIKKLGTLEISMTVTGGYTNLKQFVRYLETNIRLANVTKLKFTPAGARGISDSLTLDVNVYYQQ